jgi:hypothetical protein
MLYSEFESTSNAYIFSRDVLEFAAEIWNSPNPKFRAELKETLGEISHECYRRMFGLKICPNMIHPHRCCQIRLKKRQNIIYPNLENWWNI